MDAETYRQLVTNHELTLKAMETRKLELRSEIADLSLQIRQTRMYLKRTKERINATSKNVKP